MNGPIVAIGGGELRKSETLRIDKRIVELTGKKRPRALFIPTASGDHPKYPETFRNIYGKKLGCRCETLLLIGKKKLTPEMRQLIAQADLIYVGGGNTKKMMRLWRKLGVDKLLLKAHRRGAVLSGLSAGAICWFSQGHSDSLLDGTGQCTCVRGMGLIRATLCPHVKAERRMADFKRMITRRGGFGLALDNRWALELVDGRYRIISCSKDPGAFAIYKKQGRLRVREIQSGTEFASFEELRL